MPSDWTGSGLKDLNKDDTCLFLALAKTMYLILSKLWPCLVWKTQNFFYCIVDLAPSVTAAINKQMAQLQELLQITVAEYKQKSHI